MKISEGGREGGRGVVLLKECTMHSLVQGFSDQTTCMLADAHFLASVVELIPFLSISVCLFWFQLSQNGEAEPGRDGVTSLKKWLS